MKKKSENNKEIKAMQYDTMLPTVPYQLCPKCGGDGVVLVQNWYGSPTSISSGTQTCDVCDGNKIIPMYIVPVVLDGE